MSTKAIVAIVAGIIFLGFIWYGIQTRNSFVSQENGISAAYDANKAVLDKVDQTIKGSNLSAKEYSDATIKLVNTAMTGRYGPDGSKAAMQWIQENQPNIDPAVFKTLQQVIQANYAEWSATQITLRDRVRVYENATQFFGGSIVASIFGFPRRGFDMELYKRMIVTNETSQAFQTGQMPSIDTLLNGPQ